MVAEVKREKAAHVWEREEHDHYVEPVWCTERLLEREQFSGAIYDPCCGFGHVLQAVEKIGLDHYGSDIVKRSDYCMMERDFLHTDFTTDNIICNPPFKLCNREPYPFVSKAIQDVRGKAALLLPLSWMTGAQRSQWLQEQPLFRVWVLTPRPSMPPGRVIASGEAPGNGTKDFAWFVFLKGFDGSPKLGWLKK